VHHTQDALIDRLITIRLGYFDHDTEVRITQAKSGIPKRDAETVVDIVREIRDLGLTKQGPSLRACIMIAKLAAGQKRSVRQERAGVQADLPRRSRRARGKGDQGRRTGHLQEIGRNHDRHLSPDGVFPELVERPAPRLTEETPCLAEA